MVIFIDLAWLYWSWRHRIPFAKVVLKAVTSVTKRYPALIYTGILGLIVQFAYVAWWIATLVALSSASNAENISSGATYALYVYTVIFH